MKMALLNTAILTIAGEYKLIDLTVDEARKLVRENEIDSAIGHESTAQVMTELLGTEIPACRKMFVHEVGQSALVFKLSGRPPEGKVLTAEEIEETGYKFQLLTRIA